MVARLVAYLFKSKRIGEFPQPRFKSVVARMLSQFSAVHPGKNFPIELFRRDGVERDCADRASFAVSQHATDDILGTLD